MRIILSPSRCRLRDRIERRGREGGGGSDREGERVHNIDNAIRVLSPFYARNYTLINKIRQYVIQPFPTKNKFKICKYLTFPPNLIGLLLLQSCCTASNRDLSSDEIQFEPILQYYLFNKVRN